MAALLTGDKIQAHRRPAVRKLDYKRSYQLLMSPEILRSAKSLDFISGNMTTFKRLVDAVAHFSNLAFAFLPFSETRKGMASPFSQYANALSPRKIDLLEVPEIRKDRVLFGRCSHEMYFAQKNSTGPRINTILNELKLAEYMELAFERFEQDSSHSRQSQRKKEFDAYCQENAFWLEKDAYFKTLEEEFAGTDLNDLARDRFDLSSDMAKAFTNIHAKRIRYYQFVAMETDRQVKEGLNYARERGIKIEMLLPVGVILDGVEAFMRSDRFDRLRQIGCEPEPANGYPLQLWGLAAVKSLDLFIEFLVEGIARLQKLGVDSVLIDHAAGVLGGFITFDVYDPKLLAEGVTKLLSSSNPDDAKVAMDSVKWAFKKGDETERQEFAITVLQKILEKAKGIGISAETLGDIDRMLAAEIALAQAAKDGADITVMQDAQWGSTPLAEQGKEVRLSRTHDMAPLLATLSGRVGSINYPSIDGDIAAHLLHRVGIIAPQLQSEVDWGRGEIIAKFLQIASETISEIQDNKELAKEAEAFLRKLALRYPTFEGSADLLQQAVRGEGPVAGLSQLATIAEEIQTMTNHRQAYNLPIPSERISPEFFAEIHTRFAEGSSAGVVSMPLAEMFALLPKYFRGPNEWLTTNRPGTPGEAGNDAGNWERRLPNSEELAKHPILSRLAAREFHPVGEVYDLPSSNPTAVFRAQVKQVIGESTAYQAQNGNWTVWNAPAGIQPLMEIAVAYNGPIVTDGGENKAWAHYDMSQLGFESGRNYVFHDLVTGKDYNFTGQQIAENGLRVGLNKAQNRHHFVVYEAQERLTA